MEACYTVGRAPPVITRAADAHARHRRVHEPPGRKFYEIESKFFSGKSNRIEF